MVAFADSLSALTKKRLLNNRKASSVTFSDCPLPHPVSQSRQPICPWPVQYSRCYCFRPRLSFSDSVVIILASCLTGGSRMGESRLAGRGPGKHPWRGPSLCRGMLALMPSIPRLWCCRRVACSGLPPEEVPLEWLVSPHLLAMHGRGQGGQASVLLWPVYKIKG